VKGHQDLGVTTVLSRLATMNIEMDEIAKQTVTATKAWKGQMQYQKNHGAVLSKGENW